MKKKNIYESAIRFEVSRVDGVEEIAKILGFTGRCLWDQIWNWLENKNRTEADIKALLRKLGYDIKD